MKDEFLNEDPAEPKKRGQLRDESGQSGKERNEQRIRPPGEAGLANENRPGLGTRADSLRAPPGKPPAPAGETESPDEERKRAEESARMAAEQLARSKRKEPQEQRADSMAQEEQRSTGMSGQSSGA